MDKSLKVLFPRFIVVSTLFLKYFRLCWSRNLFLFKLPFKNVITLRWTKTGYRLDLAPGYAACFTLDCKLCEGKELCVSVLPTAVSLQSETAQYSIGI